MPQSTGSDILNDPENATVDIVFVHGIFGDRRSTWQKDAFLWPDQLLSKDIPSARIISFGYSTAAVQLGQGRAAYGGVLGLISQNGFKENVELLSSELVSKRPGAISKRPLIFVAHSMGGLIVAQLIVLGDRNSSGTNVNMIAKYTKGICFLGTPFEGSSTARWGKKIIDFLRLGKSLGIDTQTKNVDDLMPQSAALVELNEAFSTALDRRKTSGTEAIAIDIACFYEAYKTKGLVIVPRDSAGPWGRDRTPIDADHEGICKFRPSDTGYQHVLSALKKMIASSPIQPKSTGSTFYNNNSSIVNQAHSMTSNYGNSGSGSSTFNFGGLGSYK